MIDEKIFFEKNLFEKSRRKKKNRQKLIVKEGKLLQSKRAGISSNPLYLLTH